MNTIILEDKFLEIFNRNIPIDEQYSIDEIKNAFLKESYSSGSKKEQQLYIIFFMECTNNEDIKELIKLCKTSSTKIKKLYQSFENEKKIEFGDFWFTRFRLVKIDKKILPRSYEIYKEIDNFELYELTPCIAYEMAIRNKEVKSLLKRYDKIKDMMKNSRFPRFFNKNNFKDAKNHPFIELLEEYDNFTFEQYEERINKKLWNYKILIDKDYKFFIDNYIDKCTELGITELSLLEKKIEDELINHYLIYPTGYRREIPGVMSIYKEEITNSKKEKNKIILDDSVVDEGINIRYEKIIHNEFIQFQGIFANNKDYYINNILPNFSRQVNDQNQIRISINFSLPEDEIIEYIRRIKKKINPKTPIELLGYKLINAENSSNMKIISSNKKEITLDITKGEKSQNKLADMLYIYDMRQKGFNNTKIISELVKNYPDKKTVISEKTIKKYFDIAKDYIENVRYKELIIGKIEKIE